MTAGGLFVKSSAFVNLSLLLSWSVVVGLVPCITAVLIGVVLEAGILERLPGYLKGQEQWVCAIENKSGLNLRDKPIIKIKLKTCSSACMCLQIWKRCVGVCQTAGLCVPQLTQGKALVPCRKKFGHSGSY